MRLAAAAARRERQYREATAERWRLNGIADQAERAGSPDAGRLAADARSAEYRSRRAFWRLAEAREAYTAGRSFAFHLAERHVFREGFEVAAWYRLVEVEPGTYPIRPETIDGRPADPAAAYYGAVDLPGTIRETFTPSLFGGVPFGLPDTSRDNGRPYTVRLRPYWYTVADYAANGERWANVPARIVEV